MRGLLCPLMAYSVEKLRFTMTGKLVRIFRSPGALTTDQLCCSELRQAGFSYDFCYLSLPFIRPC